MQTHRFLLILSFIFLSNAMYSQDYDRIDATILLYPTHCDSPEELSKFITRDFLTEEEKVRAIYSWIIQNIISNSIMSSQNFFYCFISLFFYFGYNFFCFFVTFNIFCSSSWYYECNILYQFILLFI